MLSGRFKFIMFKPRQKTDTWSSELYRGIILYPLQLHIRKKKHYSEARQDNVLFPPRDRKGCTILDSTGMERHQYHTKCIVSMVPKKARNPVGLSTALAANEPFKTRAGVGSQRQIFAPLKTTQAKNYDERNWWNLV